MTAAVVRRRRGSSSSQAWRAQRGRLGNKDGRFEANDLAFERNTLRPPTGWSSWMVAATLPAVAETAKDCRVLVVSNVRKMCETSG